MRGRKNWGWKMGRSAQKSYLTGEKREEWPPKQQLQQTQQISDSRKKLCKYLGTKPFWCGDADRHIKNKDYQNMATCCTTHSIGQPRHPATNQEMPLTPYQIDFAQKVIDGRKDFGETIQQQMRKPLLIPLN